MAIPRFIFLSVLITGLLIGLSWILTQSWIPQYSFFAISAGILVSFITGAVAYSLTYTGLKKATRKFVTFLIMGMFSKMLVGIILVLVVVIEFKPVIREYVVAYFLAYFILTAFEVYGLMRKLRA